MHLLQCGMDLILLKAGTKNILTFMKEHGYGFERITLPKITDLEKFDYVDEVYSDVDTERCIDCRRCVTACRDATDAMKNPKLNDVDYEKRCRGCTYARWFIHKTAFQ